MQSSGAKEGPFLFVFFLKNRDGYKQGAPFGFAEANCQHLGSHRQWACFVGRRVRLSSLEVEKLWNVDFCWCFTTPWSPIQFTYSLLIFYLQFLFPPIPWSTNFRDVQWLEHFMSCWNEERSSFQIRYFPTLFMLLTLNRSVVECEGSTSSAIRGAFKPTSVESYTHLKTDIGEGVVSMP